MKSLRESFEGYGGAAKSACPLYVLVCDFLLQRNEKSAFSPSFSSFFRRNLKIPPPPPFCFFTARFCYFPVCFHMQYTARRQLLPFAKRVPHTFLPRFTVFSASVFRALFPRASRSRCRPCVSAPELTILRGKNDDIWG